MTTVTTIKKKALIFQHRKFRCFFLLFLWASIAKRNERHIFTHYFLSLSLSLSFFHFFSRHISFVLKNAISPSHKSHFSSSKNYWAPGQMLCIFLCSTVRNIFVFFSYTNSFDLTKCCSRRVSTPWKYLVMRLFHLS